MSNGDAATHALAEAFGKVVEEAVGRGIKPLEDRLNSLGSRMDSLESELHEVHECVQIPEAMERRALIGQTAGK